MDTLLPVIGPSMKQLVDQLRGFAQSDETLLLKGPTGVGKTRLALWCHHQSHRASGPFESLHLIGVPEELQLGELFGWRRGAFTSAVRDNAGHVARAHGGTLFIDEIDKLSLGAQAVLLQFLDKRRYRSLGDGGPERSADVRIIAATNADLQDLVRAIRFREDLYYRINVLPFTVPPLDRRRDELVLWAEYFLAHHRATTRTGQAARFSPAALRQLIRMSWPGNLRQLDNVVRRARTLAGIDAMAMDREPAGLVIDAAHIELAVRLDDGAGSAQEDDEGSKTLAQRFEQCAASFVRTCIRRSDTSMSLDLLDGFRGLVIGTAIELLGSREQALRMLGKTHWITSRNQQRLLRRERAKLQALRQGLDLPELGQHLRFLEEGTVAAKPTE